MLLCFDKMSWNHTISFIQQSPEHSEHETDEEPHNVNEATTENANEATTATEVKSNPESDLESDFDTNSESESESYSDYSYLDSDSDWKPGSLLDPALTEEKILSILAPMNAEQAYIWGEKHPAYRTIVGESLSNDLS